jgi:LPXTG-motif cell wall-anchored protein
MRHLALLASVYALVAGLVLPGLILAQEPSPPTTAAAPPAGQTPGPTETAPPAAEAAPAEPAPPAESAPPEPQILADERDDAPAPKPRAIAAASGSVTIADFSFSPAAITVDQGDTVTWVNNGPTAHSATANGGEFDTGILKAGQSSSHTFSQAGTYSYFCQPHPFMKGTVVVQAAQTGGDGTSGGNAGGSSGGGDGGGSSSGATGGDAGAAQADGGPALPTTGADSGALLTLGGLMLLLGIAVHRRTGRTG